MEAGGNGPGTKIGNGTRTGTVQKRQKGNERLSTESAPDKVGPSGPKAMRQKGIVAGWQKTKE